MMTSRAPVGAGNNGDNDDIDVNDNYGDVQTGLFEQQAGRLVYKCTDALVLWCSGALVYTLAAGAKAFLAASLPLLSACASIMKLTGSLQLLQSH